MLRRKKAADLDQAEAEFSSSSGETLISRVMNFELVPVVRELWDGYDAWRTTRNWWVLVPCLPVLLLAGFCLIGTVANKAFGNSHLIGWYTDLAMKDQHRDKDERGDKDKSESTKSSSKAKAAEDDSGSDVEEIENKLTPYREMLYKRILDLDPDNLRAKYYVWAQTGASGNVARARTHMQELAPVNERGFMPAHAWLAMDMYLQSRAGIPINTEHLLRHLDYASNWSNVNPMLLAVYSDFLWKKGEKDVATRMATRAAGNDASYNLHLAKLYKERGMNSQASAVINKAIDLLTRQLNEDGPSNEKFEDRKAIAEAHLMENRPDLAIAVIQEGIKNRPDSAELIRFHSDLWLRQYLLSIKQTEAGISAMLVHLDNAIRADPLNPNADTELRRLMAFSRVDDEKAIEALNMQLANASARIVSHCMLAYAYRQQNRIQDSIQHWEFARRESPTFTVTLSELALTLATKVDPPRLQPANEFIQYALTLRGPVPVLLEVQALIRHAEGKPAEAIEILKQVLERDPKRVTAREAIANAYEATGNSELAEMQRTMAEELRKLNQQQIEADRERAIARDRQTSGS